MDRTNNAGRDAAMAPRQPAGSAPLRRLGSIRRTSTIDSSWSDGWSGPLRMHGRARDLLTPQDGTPPRLLAADELSVVCSPQRVIEEIMATPERPVLSTFVGERGGGHLRRVIAERLPEEQAACTPLHLLLDDISGASLVAAWAWSRWVEDWDAVVRASGLAANAGRRGRMEGVCITFQPGSSAMTEDGRASSVNQSSVRVPSLENPDDPEGWHVLPNQVGVAMRRARRLDVWRDGDLLRIDAGFQDSATTPDGHRMAVHEYRLEAVADLIGKTLLSVRAEPRILPYRECPAAAANVSALEGAPLDLLRTVVLDRLSGTFGCTHLNDLLRSLADVPRLWERLSQGGA